MNKADEKTYKFYTDNRSLCKCGHSLLIGNKHGKVICNYCGRTVFSTNPRGKKAEFEYLLKKQMKEKD